MADALDGLGRPKAVTIAQIIKSTLDEYGIPSEFGQWLKDRRNRRQIPPRFESCGYTSVRNPDAEDRLWKISGSRQVIYAATTERRQGQAVGLSREEQLKSAKDLAAGRRRGQWGQ